MIGSMKHGNTQRSTSFIIVAGPNGSRRVPLTTGKVKANVVWVDFSAFMVAFNAVMGCTPSTVTLAGTPCRFQPVVDGLMQVSCKKKAPHGLRHNANGRTKYNRHLKDTHY